jgi:hypothetical protein
MSKANGVIKFPNNPKFKYKITETKDRVILSMPEIKYENYFPDFNSAFQNLVEMAKSPDYRKEMVK